MEATKASKLTRYVAIISFLVVSTFGISKGVGRAVFILLLLVTHEFSTGTIVASYSGVFNKALLLFSSGGNAVVSKYDAVPFGIWRFKAHFPT